MCPVASIAFPPVEQRHTLTWLPLKLSLVRFCYWLTARPRSRIHDHPPISPHNHENIFSPLAMILDSVSPLSHIHTQLGLVQHRRPRFIRFSYRPDAAEQLHSRAATPDVILGMLVCGAKSEVERLDHRSTNCFSRLLTRPAQHSEHVS